MPFARLDFQQATANHLLFKSRLRAMLYGEVPENETAVLSQYACGVGQWLYSHALIVHEAIPEVHTLEVVHAAIHTTARNLIAQYRQGQPVEARQGLARIEQLADELVQLLAVVEAKLEATAIDDTPTPPTPDLDKPRQTLMSLLEQNQRLDARLKAQSLELSQKEHIFTTIMTVSPVVFWMSDHEGAITYVNQTWIEWTGKPFTAHMGENWLDSLIEEDRGRVADHFLADLTARRTYTVDFRFRRVDGAIRWCAVAGQPWYHSGGAFGGYAGSGMDMTESRATEQALYKQTEEARQVLHDFFMQAPAAHCILRGPDHVFELINPGYQELVGNRGLVGKPIREALPELEGQGFFELLDGVFTTQKAFVGQEIPISLANGFGSRTDGYITFIYQPILNSQGQTDGILVFAYEVTDQVMARQRIQESEARFRSLVEEAPVATCLFVGRELVIELANEPMIRFFGRGPSIVGKPVQAVLNGPEEPAITLLEQVFRTGEPFTAHATPANLTLDGVAGTYYFDLSLKPLRRASGEVYAILQTAVDVTTQSLARQQLEEAEAGLRGAVELAQLGTWSIDAVTNGLTYSDRLIEWFGYDPAAQAYGAVIPILQEEDQARVAAAMAWALDPQSGGVYDQVYTVIHPVTGQKRILHAQGKAVFDGAGKPIRMNGTARDITYERELQLALEHQVRERTQELALTNEELAATIKELAATNEEIDRSNGEYKALNEKLQATIGLLNRSNDNLQRFAYVASHDLQEPLRKIQQFGDLLKTEHPASFGDESVYIDRIQAAAGRMSTLIKDLLSYSKISAQSEVREPVALNQVVGEVMTDLELLIQETSAQIRVGSLPTVLGDASQLSQLFQNLLSNALKFRRPDVVPFIEVKAQIVFVDDLPLGVKPIRWTQLYHHLEVVDNGIGFETQYTERIFEVFQRLHRKHEYAGTGIGLSISERVVTNHEGAITAKSQPGQGTTFSVFLPVSDG